MSLRKAINAHCKSCIYDETAMGTWKQQVALCSVGCCELFEVRPTTDRIPDSVLTYYGIKPKGLNEETDSPEPRKTSDVGC
jgi:hypothetical protein